MKVFSQSSIENVVVFRTDGQTNDTHFLCSRVGYAHFVHIYLILSKCGVLHRLFQFGFYHNLLSNKRNQLHTFFFVKIPP